jgi:hypothetical protein
MPFGRTTHTYATLEVSRAAYDEIRKKLEDAGYQHAFHEDGLIDMHGIALTPEEITEKAEEITEKANADQPEPG